jgi:hypothetical protein
MTKAKQAEEQFKLILTALVFILFVSGAIAASYFQPYAIAIFILCPVLALGAIIISALRS